jgi:hypothetical protein
MKAVIRRCAAYAAAAELTRDERMAWWREARFRELDAALAAWEKEVGA